MIFVRYYKFQIALRRADQIAQSVIVTLVNCSCGFVIDIYLKKTYHCSLSLILAAQSSSQPPTRRYLKRRPAGTYWQWCTDDSSPPCRRARVGFRVVQAATQI
jgi:hypothetical protein